MFQDIGCFHEHGRKQLAIYNEDATGGWAFWSWRHSDEAIHGTPWSLALLDGDLKLAFDNFN
jgi:glucan 1,3-beta-glucosidase